MTENRLYPAISTEVMEGFHALLWSALEAAESGDHERIANAEQALVNFGAWVDESSNMWCPPGAAALDPQLASYKYKYGEDF